MSLILSEVTAQACRMDRSAQPRSELGSARWGCKEEALGVASQERLLSPFLPRFSFYLV